MAQSKINLPVTGSGDAAPVPVAVKKLSTGENVQQVELATAVEGGAITPIASGNPLAVTAVVTSNALPTGASTETTLAAVNTKLGSALPLPTGASTETTLAAVNTKLGSALPLPTGAATETTLAAVNTKLGSALPLPTGAATAAKQPALGTAGAASTDVITIQGIASGVAIPVSGSFTGTADLTGTASITGISTGGTVNLNGQSTLTVDVSGTWSATTGISGTVDGTTWFFLQVGQTPGSQASNLTANPTIAGNGQYIYPVAGLKSVRVDCQGYVSGTQVFTLRASTGVQMIGLGYSLPAGSQTIGSVNTKLNGVTASAGNGVSGTGTQRITIASDSTGQVQLAAPATTGGYTISRTLAAGSTNATSVKGSAGQVYGWYLANAAAYTVFLKLYNSASAPTAGSGTPVLTIPVPAGGGANVEFMRGIAFSSGIGFTITKLVADADTTVVVANDLVVNLLYA